MSQQPIETQVVLTTDNAQYDRSMQQSATYTDQLGVSVDKLSAKIAAVSKSAGRKSIGFAAADVASITAATVAYASFEKQMTALNAQAAVLNKNYVEGRKLAGQYSDSVNKLRSDFGASTSNATALVQTISRMTDQTASVDKLTNTFQKMSNATQEGATGLASSVLQLQRTMGTSQKDTDKYANSLTVLAANSNTSATAIADFAQQIAPVGRLVGQSQADIQGVSTAFLKAGQDGYRAATVYNKVLTDITYATQSGSPELAKYANFVGMTVENFKSLSGTEKILSFFDQVNRLGPEAITSLNRMGLDGANTVKAISAVTQQTGGIGASIAQSRAAMKDNAIDRGSQAAMAGLVDDVGKLRAELSRTAESMGDRFAPAAGVFVKSMTEMSKAARMATDGPLGTLAATLAAITAPLAAVGGAGLIAAPALAKLAGGALLLRGSGAMGLREGLRGAPMVTPGVSQMNQGPTGLQIAANGSWFQRYQYNAFNRIGAGIAGVRDLGRTSGFFGAPGRDPLWQRGVAGGLNATAYGMRNFGAGLFAPLGFAGYNDPTARPRLFNDSRSPFAQMRDAYRERFTGRSAAMSGGAAGIDRGVSLFDRDVRVTEDGRVTSSMAGAAQRAAVTREATAMSAAFANATRAAGTMAGALASAAANTGFLAGKGLGRAGAWAMGNTATLGMGAMLAGGAMGLNSNALTFGSMGLMFGGMGLGAAGAGIGLGFDIRQQNQDFNQAVSFYNKMRKEGTLVDRYQAGQTIQGNYDQMLASTSGTSGWTRAIPVVGGYLGGASLSSAYNQAKYGLEGIFTGTNPVEKRLDAVEKVQRDDQNTVGAFTAIASQMGQPIDSFNFESKADWAKLDMVLQSITPKMEKLGITTEDIVDTWAGGDTDAWRKLLDQLANPAKYTGLSDRISALRGGTGMGFINDAGVQRAVEQPENMNAQYRAVNNFFRALTDSGLGTGQIIRRMGNIQATVGDPSDPYYQLAGGVSAQAQRQLGFAMPFMSRTQQFSAQANLFRAQRSIIGGDPNQQQNMMAAEDAFMGAANSQGEYFKSLLLQQREFNISRMRSEEDFAVTRERMDQQYSMSRARSQEDFNISRKQQEEDYQLSRARAEEDYAIMQRRSAESYARSMRRGQRDFDISRMRQEKDYQHSVQMMVEAQAKSMYNIFDRVRVESTNSANFLLFNGEDQLKRIQEQSQNLDKLRQAGVSDDVIQQLGLTDTANAQQLSRFVAEVANNPEMVAQFNKQIAQRLKAAAALVQDSSSSEWEEFQRQYRQARNRAEADFQRQVARSHRDFKRQMSEMEDDFRRSMNRQATDFETAQERQEDAFSRSMKRGAQDYGIAVSNMTEDFNKSMRRAQEDLNRMAKEISGDLEQILEKATNKLGGTASKQAKIVLDALRGLDTDASKTGIQLMRHMAKIFGFTYEVGGLTSDPTAGAGSGPGQSNNPHYGMAEGGVLPGYTPGRDVHRFTSKTGGSLALSGGEAIMVPEWVDKMGGPRAVERMNYMARYGGMHAAGCECHGFKSGGTINPDMRVYMDGEPVSAITKAQILLAEKTFGRDYRIMQGSWQPYTSYSGSSHMGPGVVDASPGNFLTQSDLRRVGFAAWARNIEGAASAGSGGHVHAVSRLDPGARNHPQLSSFARGEDGLGGPDYGPNPPLLPHLLKKLDQFMNLSLATGSPGVGVQNLESILKKRYESVEQAAAKVTLNGGLFKDGWWSKQINKSARHAYNERMGTGVEPTSTWFARGGIFTTPTNVNVAEHGPEMLIPLNGSGVNFLADLFRRVNVDVSAKQLNVQRSQSAVGHTGGGTTYQIDRSTTFTGAITVQANNPNELIQQLKARQRVQAMAQQSLGGVRV